MEKNIPRKIAYSSSFKAEKGPISGLLSYSGTSVKIKVSFQSYRWNIENQERLRRNQHNCIKNLLWNKFRTRLDVLWFSDMSFYTQLLPEVPVKDSVHPNWAYTALHLCGPKAWANFISLQRKSGGKKEGFVSCTPPRNFIYLFMVRGTVSQKTGNEFIYALSLLLYMMTPKAGFLT